MVSEIQLILVELCQDTSAENVFYRGVVQNILFENFYVEGAAAGPSISENSGNNGSS